MLIQLTKGNANIQKIVAFENAFERLLDIIRDEGNSDGGNYILSILSHQYHISAVEELLLICQQFIYFLPTLQYYPYWKYALLIPSFLHPLNIKDFYKYQNQFIGN